MPGLLDDLRGRFAALPAAQRAVIGVGVPLTAGAALVANIRGRTSADPENDSQDPGGVPGQRVPIPAADNYDLVRSIERLSVTSDRIFGALTDAEGRISDKIADAIDAIGHIPEAATPSTGGGGGSLPVPTPTPEPLPDAGSAPSAPGTTYMASGATVEDRNDQLVANQASGLVLFRGTWLTQAGYQTALRTLAETQNVDQAIAAGVGAG